MSDLSQVLDALEKQNVDREHIKTDLKLLSESMQAFQKQYDYDMRGDPKINGYKGLIGEVRELKNEITKYPSFAAWVAKNPSRGVATILSSIAAAILTWFALHALSSLPGFPEWLKTFFDIFK